MQPTNSRDALSELQNFQQNRRKSQDVLRESETRLGLPTATQRQAGLRAAISNTENLIRSVEPSVSGRTSGSLVTEAQKTRLVGLERQPLDDSFREQSRAFEGETANINELKRQALTDSQLAIAEDDNRQNTLQGLYSTLYQREQDEIARQERERAFAEAQRQARAASGGGLGGLLGNNWQYNPNVDPVRQRAGAQTPQDQAYLSVKKFLGQGKAAAESDFQATLRSANNGNAMDKLKVELYRQNGIGLGSPAPNIAQRRNNAITGALSLFSPTTAGITGAVANRGAIAGAAKGGYNSVKNYFGF